MNLALRSINHRLVYVALLMWTTFFGTYSTAFLFQLLDLAVSDISTYVNLAIVVGCAIQLNKLNNSLRIFILIVHSAAIVLGLISHFDDFIEVVTDVEDPVFMVISLIPFLFVIALILMNPKKIDHQKAFEDREDLLDL